METKMFKTATTDLAAAAELIKKGQVVAFPTETVYGLGADATKESAVKKVFAAKNRPSDNPLIVTVANVEMVKRFVSEIPVIAQKLIANFWPGSLTIIMRYDEGALSPVVTGGLPTVAFRLPASDVTREFIALADTPIVGPSANTSGKPSPTTAQHVWHDLQGKIAGIIDDGAARVGVESTVIDITTATPTILRPGAVTQEALEAVIGEVNSEHRKVGIDETPKAPGMKYRHYAPDVPVYMVQSDKWEAAIIWAQQQLEPVGIMAPDAVIEANHLAGMDFVWSLGNDVTTASAKLFAGLRYFDDRDNIETILVHRFADQGVGRAYNNRLGKAASDQYFDVDM
ncbi:L-threonylcarbamoyladenylate synthase [Periweissella fabalis]|uniref:L-threonylcarbamoyladenylate synthase n=1 Tax=Periweissella fabalis TaxID=1070421 RepID=UPI001B3500E6|nr:L-threonylcarbamoyladenylate synthase [Periweissella fabalis]MCM0598891.1 threonylcarbamoyl-AMP synthase [Periweissella fabalis]